MGPREIIRYLKEADWYRYEKLLRDYGEDVIEAAIACGVNLNDIEGSYVGDYSSDEEFAQKMVYGDDGGYQNKPSWIHIDWERTAADLMLDYVEDGGHYFRVM